MNEIIANFLDIVKNKFAKFDGRARRKEYWYFVLGFVALYFAIVILMIILGIISSTLATIIGSVLGLGLLGLIVPSIAVGIRRMHDIGKSGWFILIPVYSLILAATEGVKGDNEYGSDPKKDTTIFKD